jgi:thiol:disulfide interchange protein
MPLLLAITIPPFLKQPLPGMGDLTRKGELFLLAVIWLATGIGESAKREGAVFGWSLAFAIVNAAFYGVTQAQGLIDPNVVQWVSIISVVVAIIVSTLCVGTEAVQNAVNQAGVPMGEAST